MDSEVFEMKPTRTRQEAEITQKSPGGDDFLSDDSSNFINLYCAVQHEAVRSIGNRKLPREAHRRCPAPATPAGCVVLCRSQTVGCV